MVLIAAFLIASLSSFTSGFFGSGSGMVVIPLLSKLLYFTDVPVHANMHVVIGTAFALGFVITSIATFVQHKRNMIDWQIVKIIFIPSMCGVIVGSTIAHSLNNKYLHIFFGGFILLLALQQLLSRKSLVSRDFSNRKEFLLVSFLVSITVGMTSVGALNVPYLRKYGVSLMPAIATTQAIGLFNTFLGTIIYIILGFGNKTLPVECIGYVNWYLLIPLVCGAIIFARFGVKLAHRVPIHILNRLFCGFLFIVGCDMLLTA